MNRHPINLSTPPASQVKYQLSDSFPYLENFNDTVINGREPDQAFLILDYHGILKKQDFSYPKGSDEFKKLIISSTYSGWNRPPLW